jgi:hypothetical protein
MTGAANGIRKCVAAGGWLVAQARRKRTFIWIMMSSNRFGGMVASV